MNKFQLAPLMFAVFLLMCATEARQAQEVTEATQSKAAFKNVSATHIDSDRLKANSMDGQAIDIDQDGDLDIIEANETNNRILINTGEGHFQEESETRLPSATSAARIYYYLGMINY